MAVDIKKLRRVIEGDDSGLKPLEDGVERATKKSKGLGDAASFALGTFASSLMQKATDAVVDFAEKAVKGYGDLEQQVANISTIKPEIDNSAVFAALNELQTRVPQTAAQLGESLYDVFSSVTVTQKEGLQLVEEFAKCAVGAQTDAKTF